MKNTVKEERIKNQLTQIQLAELIGVSRQTIFQLKLISMFRRLFCR